MNNLIGTDICEISRFSKFNDLDKFLNKYFTKNEIYYINTKGNKNQTIAGLFSAKEAFVKALGCGFGKIRPEHIEILHDENNAPYINFDCKENYNIGNISLSISHDGNYAISNVIVEQNKYKNTSILEYSKIIKNRILNGHKGDFGKVGIIGGSTGMTGSVILSAKSALRTGSGLVYNICPKNVSQVIEYKSLENIVIPVEDDNKGYFTDNSLEIILNKIVSYDSIAIGCGMSKNIDYNNLLRNILLNFNGPIAIDGDAIFYMSKNLDILRKRCNIILTPHEKEFQYLSGIDIQTIKTNRKETLIDFVNSQSIKSTIILKGKETLIYNGDFLCTNTSGNDGMATAGSGDVLTGILLSLLGQGYETFLAAKLGTFIHGLSGDIAKYYLGKDSIIASDLIKYLPNAIKEIRG